ncbi:hypothetical protein [Ferribacterium limneticum]|uniref:hypothetical protein n=1 Tax=Ferribacterium limneticum TaxID=76259 RepID=UPI001CF8C4B4|nr:hypothetical protein [Ferribacterium limneticum]UCV22548.1 hypothetical protein KI613_18875 [Ferribacterium limneticum]
MPLIMGSDPNEIWAQARHNAETNSECRVLMAEIGGIAEGRMVQSSFRELAKAVRHCLRKSSNKRATISAIKTWSVAWPMGSDCVWLPVLADGESELKQHPAISRWLSEPGAPCPFSSDTIKKLAWASIQQEFWSPNSGQPHALRYVHEYGRQLEQQLRSGATTRGSLRLHAPGVFQIFRPSAIYPGRYVVGIFGVALVTDYPCNELPEIDNRNCAGFDVLRTVEVHRVAPDDDVDMSNQSHNLLAAPSATDIHFGYLVKKSHNIICHSFNAVTCAFQLTIFRDYLLSEPPLSENMNSGMQTHKRAHLQMATGVSVGADFFCVPTVILRINNIDLVGIRDDNEFIARLRGIRFWESAGIFTAKNIPDFILRQFMIIRRQIDLREGTFTNLG